MYTTYKCDCSNNSNISGRCNSIEIVVLIVVVSQ